MFRASIDNAFNDLFVPSITCRSLGCFIHNIDKPSASSICVEIGTAISLHYAGLYPDGFNLKTRSWFLVLKSKLKSSWKQWRGKLYRFTSERSELIQFLALPVSLFIGRSQTYQQKNVWQNIFQQKLLKRNMFPSSSRNFLYQMGT